MRTHFRVFSVILLTAILTSTRPLPSQTVATDRIPLPPLREQISSPGGEYLFVLSNLDGWKSPKSTGELFHIVGENRQLLWSRHLPHHFRPRYAVVAEEGTVVLLDEWINVKSPYAVMVISRENRLVAEHDFDAVARILQVPAARIVRMASHGWWIVSPPTVDSANQTVQIEAAGKVLAIGLSDGHLVLPE